MQPVKDLLAHAIGSTLQLVTAATILSLVIGVTVGIVSALRQYSGFDYGIIFLSFLLYSLPSFWVAVLLKQWAAIGFNDFLKDPVIAWSVIAGIAVVAGLFWSLAVGGRRRTPLAGLRGRRCGDVRDVRLPAALGLVGASADRPHPAADPRAAAPRSPSPRCSQACTTVARMWTALTTVGVGLALYLPMQVVFDSIDENNWIIFGLALLAMAVGFLIGRALRRSRLGHLRAHRRRGGVHHRRAHLHRPGHAGLAAVLQRR